MQPKLYAVARRDLSKSQQAVQAGHAVAQYLLENPDTKWTNGTLVFLKAPLEQIEDLRSRLDHYAEFYEPDIGNELTAIASVGSEEVFQGLALV